MHLTALEAKHLSIKPEDIPRVLEHDHLRSIACRLALARGFSLERPYDKQLHAGFVIPVIGGKTYLGKRGTDPDKGKFCGIAGKSEYVDLPSSASTFKALPEESPWSYREEELDKRAQREGRELPSVTALRETAEELFQKDYQTAFVGWDTQLTYIGHIFDSDHGVNLQWYTMSLNPAWPLNLKQREITEFTPLENIALDGVNMNTRIALQHVRHGIQQYPVAKVFHDLVIPEDTGLYPKRTSMIDTFGPWRYELWCLTNSVIENNLRARLRLGVDTTNSSGLWLSRIPLGVATDEKSFWMKYVEKYR
ncbi:MAG: hypothetical protein ACE5FT_03215 [Candidatus Nanoarchaeia archaeon]